MTVGRWRGVDSFLACGRQPGGKEIIAGRRSRKEATVGTRLIPPSLPPPFLPGEERSRRLLSQRFEGRRGGGGRGQACQSLPAARLQSSHLEKAGFQRQQCSSEDLMRKLEGGKNRTNASSVRGIASRTAQFGSRRWRSSRLMCPHTYPNPPLW